MGYFGTAFRRASLIGAGLAAVCMAAPAVAQSAQAQSFDIASQPLRTALRAAARQTGLDLIAASDVVGDLRSAALKGDYTPQAAFAELLAGTGLTAVITERTVLIRGRAVAPEGASPAADELGRIVVTGSRIRGVVPPGSSVVTVDREAIDRSGYTSTQQLLQSLPQAYGAGSNEATTGTSSTGGANLNSSYGSSINLRGLGPASTLVLLDGNRPPLGGIGGVFADISMIPVSAIERIEVLADGASAIYGSDAVAGVVNIIPRRRFSGLETSVRYGSADGDFSEVQVSQIAGTEWTGGHALIAYEYNGRGRLAARKRAFATEDLRAFGGGDYRNSYANPGTITAGGQTFAIPTGQDGTHLTAAQLVPSTANRRDGYADADILPRQRRHSVYASAEQEVGDVGRLYAEALFSRRAFDRRVNSAENPFSITIPTTNAFYVDPIGTHAALSERYDFTSDFGPRTARGHVTAWAGVAGGEARFGGWALDLHGTFGRQRDLIATVNTPNRVRLAAALADSDAATAFNALGDGSHTNPATIAKLRGSSTSYLGSTVWSAAAKADGPLFALPGGMVRLAAGAEYRSEKATSSTLNDTTSPTPTFIGNIDNTRTIRAAYGEILIPLVGDDFQLPMMRSLLLSVAGRYERYDDFGSTRNPRIGLSWDMVEGLKLRGTYSTSFRAPSVNELRQVPSSIIYFGFPLADPASPTGTTNALILRGNDPNMGPERARTMTAGFDLTPKALPGLKLSATFFDIRYKDRIVDLTSVLLRMLVFRQTYQSLITDAPSAALVQSYYDSPYYADLAGVKASSIKLILNARTQNLAVLRERGVDIDASWRFALGAGEADVGASATYLFRLTQAASKDGPAQDILNTIGNPVDLRMKGHVGWTRDGLSLLASANYTNGYTNNIPAVPAHVRAWTTFDAQIGYDFGERSGLLGGTGVALTATNLFDRDPPFAEFSLSGVTAIGYDPQNANAIGRVISLQVTRRW